MKKQNEPKKTNRYKVYDDSRPTYIRCKEVIDAIPDHCWWLRQYLRGVYFTRGAK